MTETHPQINLQIHAPGADAAELAELTGRLRNELLDLYEAVQSVDYAPVPVEEGAKGAIGLDWNSIIITLITSGGVATTAITAIVTLAQSWLKRNEGRNVSIEFSNGSKLTAQNLTPAEQKRLIDALLQDARGFTP